MSFFIPVDAGLPLLWSRLPDSSQRLENLGGGHVEINEILCVAKIHVYYEEKWSFCTRDVHIHKTGVGVFVAETG